MVVSILQHEKTMEVIANSFSNSNSRLTSLNVDKSLVRKLLRCWQVDRYILFQICIGNLTAKVIEKQNMY